MSSLQGRSTWWPAARRRAQSGTAAAELGLAPLVAPLVAVEAAGWPLHCERRHPCFLRFSFYCARRLIWCVRARACVCTRHPSGRAWLLPPPPPPATATCHPPLRHMRTTPLSPTIATPTPTPAATRLPLPLTRGCHWVVSPLLSLPPAAAHRARLRRLHVHSHGHLQLRPSLPHVAGPL